MPLLAPLADLHPDHKAQTARHDQEHDHSLYIIITDIGSQRGILPEPAKQIEACIAERRDGRECADPDALRTKLRHKGDHQKHHTNDLKGHRQLDHDLQHIGGLRVAAGRNAFSQQPQILKAHPAFGSQRKKAGQGHQAQTAHLDQQQNHRLPKGRELRPGIPHDQTCHTGGTGGSEHGIHHAQPTAAAGNGQCQQQRSQRDQQHKADADDLRCTAAQQPAAPTRCSLFPFHPHKLAPFCAGPPVLHLHFILHPCRA